MINRRRSPRGGKAPRRGREPGGLPDPELRPETTAEWLLPDATVQNGNGGAPTTPPVVADARGPLVERRLSISGEASTWTATLATRATTLAERLRALESTLSERRP